jgi:hypothetical protein
MSDEEWIAAFEHCRLSKQDFHHVDHVRMAFLYVGRFPALEAVHRFSEALKRFAAAGGNSHLYHETITWAFLFLTRERLARSVEQSGRLPDWKEFASENPDLLNWKDNLLKHYYREQTLASELARKIFILPDRSLPHF